MNRSPDPVEQQGEEAGRQVDVEAGLVDVRQGPLRHGALLRRFHICNGLRPRWETMQGSKCVRNNGSHQHHHQNTGHHFMKPGSSGDNGKLGVDLQADPSLLPAPRQELGTSWVQTGMKNWNREKNNPADWTSKLNWQPVFHLLLDPQLPVFSLNMAYADCFREGVRWVLGTCGCQLGGYNSGCVWGVGG